MVGIRLVFAILLCIVIFAGFAAAMSQMFALQGKVTQSGSVMSDGNVRVLIYDANESGTLVYDSVSDYNGQISNGFVDIMVGDARDLDLNYGQHYWMDLRVNGGDLNFGNNDRMEFETAHGDFNRIMYRSDLIFDSNGTERMRLTSGGGLAIATSSIDDTAHILDVNEEGDLGVRIFSTTTNEAAYIDLESDTAAGSLSVEGSAVSVGFMQNTMQITLDVSGSAILIAAEKSDANIDFFTGGELDGAAEQYRRMRITSDGNVYIGTDGSAGVGSTYNYILDINATKKRVAMRTDDDTDYTGIDFYNAGGLGGTGANPSGSVGSVGASYAYSILANKTFLMDEVGGLALYAYGTDTNIDFYVGNAVDASDFRMRITHDGNVLIGRDRPGVDGTGVPYILDINSHNSNIALRIDDSTGTAQLDFYVAGNASGAVGATGHAFGFDYLQKFVALIGEGSAGYGVALVSPNPDGNIDFYAGGVDAETYRRMRITSGGTIAINQDDPNTEDYILDINVLKGLMVRIMDEALNGSATLMLETGESIGELSAIGAQYGGYAHLDGSLLLYAYEDTNRLILAAQKSDANIDFYTGGDIDAGAGTQYLRMTIAADGNVGIGLGIVEPKATLDINSFMLLEPTDTPLAPCNPTYEGLIYANDTNSKLCYCNGAAWADMNGFASKECLPA